MYTYGTTPIARGGTEVINVNGYPFVANNMWTPFDAVVNGSALALEQAGPYMNRVTVTGAAAGHADLCIYDVDSDTVHDGTRVLVGEIASVFAAPTSRFYESTTETYPFAHWLLHTGKQRYLGLAMVSADNWRLVDSGLKLEVALDAQPFTTPSPDSWDSVVFDAIGVHTARLRGTLSSGEQVEVSAALTDKIDHLVYRQDSSGKLDQLVVNGSTYECFETYRDGVRVFGSQFTFSAGSSVRFSSTSAPNCTYVSGVEVGSGTLVVTVDDQALELPYTVKPTGS